MKVIAPKLAAWHRMPIRGEIIDVGGDYILVKDTEASNAVIEFRHWISVYREDIRIHVVE